MQIDLDRLEAMRKAWLTARATSNGLRQAMIEAEQHRNRTAAHLAAVRVQALAYQSPRRPGEIESDTTERRNAEANARSERERQLRVAFKDHPAQLAQVLGEMNLADGEDVARVIAEGEAALARIDAEVDELRQQQGRWGSRTGLLRQTIEAAEAWLALHPEALQQVVEDAA